ncbi:hypothetical protein NSTC745_01154 [Nostoc sp. DSM 114161]|jgi:hypothetical protein
MQADLSCIGLHLCCIDLHLCCIGLHLCCIGLHLCCIDLHLCCIDLHLSCIGLHLCCIGLHLCCMSVAKISLAQSLWSKRDVCLEKFRSAEAAAPTPVAFRRKATGTHWLDFSLRQGLRLSSFIIHISINYIGQRS